MTPSLLLHMKSIVHIYLVPYWTDYYTIHTKAKAMMTSQLQSNGHNGLLLTMGYCIYVTEEVESRIDLEIRATKVTVFLFVYYLFIDFVLYTASIIIVLK